MNWVIYWDKLGFSCKELHRWPSKRAKSVFRSNLQQMKELLRVCALEGASFWSHSKGSSIPLIPPSPPSLPQQGCNLFIPTAIHFQKHNKELCVCICEICWCDSHSFTARPPNPIISKFLSLWTNLKKNIFIEKILLFAINWCGLSFASLFKCQKGHLSMFSQVCPLNCWLVWEIVGNGSGLSATKAKTWNRILVTEISYFPSNTYFFCKSWQALETKYLIFALDFKTGQILDHLPWYISFCRKKRGKCKLEEKILYFWLSCLGRPGRMDGRLFYWVLPTE